MKIVTVPALRNGSKHIPLEVIIKMFYLNQGLLYQGLSKY
jgi:hypothetical protein